MNIHKYDTDSFAKIYEDLYPKINRYILKKVNSDQYVADDLTSITFEKAYKNIKTFKWEGVPISAWIYRIANNTVIDHYRKTTREKTVSNEDIPLKDPSLGPEQATIIYDTNTRIKNLLKKIPERDRQIIILKFYEGYTNKTIAEKLGFSETNVGTILHRAMQKLKSEILSNSEI